MHSQLANWLESYAESLDLNIWTSSTVAGVKQDETTKEFTVVIKRGDASITTLKVKYLVMATGTAQENCEIPSIPGMVSGCYFFE
jgi:cation diffusion facilitator CzcD-associated flavoprotein CzcO